MVEISYDTFFTCLATNEAFRGEVWDEVPQLERVTNVRLMMAFQSPSTFAHDDGVRSALQKLLSPGRMKVLSQRAHQLLSKPSSSDPFEAVSASAGIARLFREQPAYREEDIAVVLHTGEAAVHEDRSVTMSARIDDRQTVLEAREHLKSTDKGTSVFVSGGDTVVLFHPDRVDWQSYNDPYFVESSWQARKLMDNRMPAGALFKPLIMSELFPDTDWDRMTLLTDIRVNGHDDFDPHESFAGYRIRGFEGRGWQDLSVALDPERLARYANIRGISTGTAFTPQQAAELIPQLRELHYTLRARGIIYDPTYISQRGTEIIPQPGGLLGLLDPAMFLGSDGYLRDDRLPHGADPYDCEAPFVPNFAGRSLAYKEMKDCLSAIIYGLPLGLGESRKLEDLPLELSFNKLADALGVERLASLMRETYSRNPHYYMRALGAFTDYLFQYIDRKLQLKAGIEVPCLDSPGAVSEMINVLDADLARSEMPTVVSLNDKAPAVYQEGRAILKNFLDDPSSRSAIGKLLLRYRGLQGARQRTMFLETVGTEQLAMFATVGLTSTAYLSKGDFDVFSNLTMDLMDHHFDANADVLTWNGFVDVVDPKSNMHRSMMWYNPLRGFVKANRVNFRKPTRLGAATRLHQRAQPTFIQGRVFK